MAAPTFFGYSAPVAATASVDVVWPAGHAIDDVGILFIETSGTGTVLTPSGWTHVPGSPLIDDASVNGSQVHVLWRRATSAAEANVPTGDSGDHQVAIMLVARGCLNTGDPWDAVASAIKTVASTTATCPSVTTSVADTLMIFAASRPDDSGVTNHFGAPVNANLTGIASSTVGEAGTTSGHGGGGILTYGTYAGPGAVGTTTMTKTVSTIDVTFTIALRSTAGATSGRRPRLRIVSQAVQAGARY